MQIGQSIKIGQLQKIDASKLRKHYSRLRATALGFLVGLMIRLIVIGRAPAHQLPAM